MNKRCSKCGEEKSTIFFSKNKSQKDGYSNWCKSCESEKYKTYYKNNKYSVLNRIKEYIRTPQGRKAHGDTVKSYRKNNPEKYKAHTKLSGAIRRGEIKPASSFVCFVCEKNKAEHYHHHKGYSKENILNVIPVCAMCHKMVEKN